MNMNQAPSHAAAPADTTAGEKTPPPMFFNDVHSQHCKPPALGGAEWSLFPRLPAELRLRVWLLYLRQYRMIELEVFASEDEEVDSYPGRASQPPRYYISRNGLGNIVSNRGYELSGRDCRGCPASITPLLWVNTEARQAALSFYSVHLPMNTTNGRRRFLYLNPMYDVVAVEPQDCKPGSNTLLDRPNPATLLADLLHDIKAYDRKGQGLAHLALHRDFFSFDPLEPVRLSPPALHPAAAASFVDILRHRLRSVLCVVGFRARRRALDEFPFGQGYTYHFAQTFPLARPRALADGALRWLDTDPRPGLGIDLRQVPLDRDPRELVRGWERIEEAFGITAAEEQGQGDKPKTGRRRLYICPVVDWPLDMEPQGMRVPTEGPTSPPQNGNGDGQGQGAPRAELARFLRKEDEGWLAARKFHSAVFDRSLGPGRPGPLMPRHGCLMDAETFAMMERLPCTAVGMWLFPPEAFSKVTNLRRSCFDLSAARPGLMLFDV